MFTIVNAFLCGNGNRLEINWKSPKSRTNWKFRKIGSLLECSKCAKCRCTWSNEAIHYSPCMQSTRAINDCSIFQWLHRNSRHNGENKLQGDLSSSPFLTLCSICWLVSEGRKFGRPRFFTISINSVSFIGMENSMFSIRWIHFAIAGNLILPLTFFQRNVGTEIVVVTEFYL